MSISMYLLLTGFYLPSLSGREFMPIPDLAAANIHHAIVAQGIKDISNSQPDITLMPVFRDRDAIHHKPKQHSYKPRDRRYNGIESPRGQAFVATTYIKYRPGEDKKIR